MLGKNYRGQLRKLAEEEARKTYSFKSGGSKSKVANEDQKKKRPAAAQSGAAESGATRSYVNTCDRRLEISRLEEEMDTLKIWINVKLQLVNTLSGQGKHHDADKAQICDSVYVPREFMDSARALHPLTLRQAFDDQDYDDAYDYDYVDLH